MLPTDCRIDSDDVTVRYRTQSNDVTIRLLDKVICCYHQSVGLSPVMLPLDYWTESNVSVKLLDPVQ
jgi:hypothetical protein